jgi:nucleoside phosphorylase
MLAFITALREERAALRKVWGLSPAGRLGGLELETGPGCVHVLTGMGAGRVLAGFDVVKHAFQPKLVVLTGYSVGLRPEIKVGELVCDSRSHPPMLDLLREFTRKTRFSPVATCGFLNSASQKRAFSEKHSENEIADLESESFLVAASDTPALVVRSVSDTLDTDLPLDFQALTDKRGLPSHRAIGWKVARNPFLLPRLLRLAKESGHATETLAHFFEETKPVMEHFILSGAP